MLCPFSFLWTTAYIYMLQLKSRYLWVYQFYNLMLIKDAGEKKGKIKLKTVKITVFRVGDACLGAKTTGKQRHHYHKIRILHFWLHSEEMGGGNWKETQWWFRDWRQYSLSRLRKCYMGVPLWQNNKKWISLFCTPFILYQI